MLIAFHRDAVSTVATGPDGKAVAAPAPTRRSIQLDDGESEEAGEEDGAEADEMAELLDVVAWQWAAPYRKSGPSTKSNQTRIIKTPGGRLVYQYTKKRASGPKCPVTGKKIQGNIGSYLINRGG